MGSFSRFRLIVARATPTHRAMLRRPQFSRRMGHVVPRPFTLLVLEEGPHIVAPGKGPTFHPPAGVIYTSRLYCDSDPERSDSEERTQRAAPRHRSPFIPTVTFLYIPYLALLHVFCLPHAGGKRGKNIDSGGTGSRCPPGCSGSSPCDRVLHTFPFHHSADSVYCRLVYPGPLVSACSATPT